MGAQVLNLLAELKRVVYAMVAKGATVSRCCRERVSAHLAPVQGVDIDKLESGS